MTGSGGFDTNQVSVAATATLIVARRRGRLAVTITNLGTNDVYLGHDNGVLTSTGTLLDGVKGASVTIPTQEAVWGIAGSTQAVSVLETY